MALNFVAEISLHSLSAAKSILQIKYDQGVKFRRQGIRALSESIRLGMIVSRAYEKYTL